MKIDKGRAQPPGAPGTRNETDGRDSSLPMHRSIPRILCSAGHPAPHRDQHTRPKVGAPRSRQPHGHLSGLHVQVRSWRLAWQQVYAARQLQIAEKIGDNAPPGTVFKSRRRTGEIVLANSPGRDPIVTRILWLRGLRSAKCERIWSGHLHSRHTGGTADRNASELRMYSNALNRHRPIVQHRWSWRGGHDRERAARQRSSRYGFRSFNGTGKHGAVCDALGNSLPTSNKPLKTFSVTHLPWSATGLKPRR